MNSKNIKLNLWALAGYLFFFLFYQNMIEYNYVFAAVYFIGSVSALTYAASL